MRLKSASGKAIIVLCLASFLAGSLFMSRTLSRSYVSEEEDQHLAKHLSKHLEIQKDCDEHKRKLIESKSRDIIGEVSKTHQAVKCTLHINSDQGSGISKTMIIRCS